jgi:hypothetical protein
LRINPSIAVSDLCLVIAGTDLVKINKNGTVLVKLIWGQIQLRIMKNKFRLSIV